MIFSFLRTSLFNIRFWQDQLIAIYMSTSKPAPTWKGKKRGEEQQRALHGYQKCIAEDIDLP